MMYKYLIINIDRDESEYSTKLKLPRKKTVIVNDIYFQYDWDEEGTLLIEWTNRTFLNHKDMFNYFYDFNRILSFLYRVNIGLLDDERIRFLEKYLINEQNNYTGKNKNVLNIKQFYNRYKNNEILKKREFNSCVNILNKSVYFHLDLGLQEETFIYLYKIVEIISNAVVSKDLIENNLKGLKNDQDLENIIKKYLCEENGLGNYPDIISTLSNKIRERYNSATIKIYHLNLNLRTCINLGSLENIKEIVDIRNTLSHANPIISDKEKFDRAFKNIFRYVPEIICKYYINENYKDIDCTPNVKF